MGMFDDLRCEYPLPGNVPVDAGSLNYQTKDTPDQYCRQYLITKEGMLTRDGNVEDFSGGICFYAGNVVASGPGIYTKDGEDAFWLEYQSVFVHGKIVNIELVRYESEPAQKSSEAPRPWDVRFESEEERMAWWKKEAKAFDDWRETEKRKREVRR